MTRALYASYAGPLYQVVRSDNATLDIGLLSPGGVVNAGAQDAFCNSSNPPSIPSLSTIVALRPSHTPSYSFRHCSAQGFLTPDEENLDHRFTLVAALNGSPGGYSFRSVNFPTYYLAPVASAEPGRLGIVEAPSAADATWSVTPAAGGGFVLTNLGKGGSMAVGNNLTGACASNYAPPSASVYLSSTPTAWLLSLPTSACQVKRIYDQSPQGNHLDTAPAGGAAPHPDKPVNAAAFPVMVGGHPAYGAYFVGGMGYRKDDTTGIAKGNEPETIYMVVSGREYNSGCCFDYGNAEFDNHDDGAGTMECVYFGSWDAAGSGWCGGTESGPWVMADLENGLWACNASSAVNPLITPMRSDFVTGMVKGGSNGWGIKGGNATEGPLAKLWEGPRPKGYQPMRKQGAIILGIGGDNSNSAIGVWFEGVLTSGYSTDAADDMVQKDIIAAGYQRL